jgi:hypothetical protein
MLTFLTPAGALVGLAVLLPLIALAAGARRVHGVRTLLGLRRPRTGTDVARLAALIAGFVLLALAGTQPALSHETSQRVRRDAQALFVVDTSRSMAASSGTAGATRLVRATAAAAKLRASIPDVESGIATLTDRVLPNLLPVADIPSFDATLERSVGIERPPPRSAAVRATTYAALSEIPAAGFFDSTAGRRVVVLLTDGESGPFDPGAVAASLRPTRLVVIRFWRASESIAGDPAYRPDPASSAALDALAASAGGRVFGEGDVGSAGAAIRASIGTGPTTRVAARTRRETALAPFVVAAALVPLVLFLRRRRGGLEYA